MAYENLDPVVSLAPIRSRGRLVLPKSCRNAVVWLEASKSQDVVLELAEPGRVIIAPEDTKGRELAQQSEVIRQEVTEPKTRDQLLIALALAFRRSAVEPSGRLPLDPETLDHLSIESVEYPVNVYLVAKSDALEIWSRDYHAEFRRKHLQELLDQLPEGMRHDQRLLRLISVQK